MVFANSVRPSPARKRVFFYGLCNIWKRSYITHQRLTVKSRKLSADNGESVKGTLIRVTGGDSSEGEGRRIRPGVHLWTSQGGLQSGLSGGRD